jgi:ADP-heptose:LPS heptosyltransferase
VSASPQKILALQFKYFGDAVLMTPALRALKQHFAGAEIHVLVPEEITPLLQNLPFVDRVWAMPRRRGRASLSRSLPIIGELRREKFDRSVDFASNDRGAIISRFIGAKDRLGWDERGGFLGRKLCYNTRVAPPKVLPHESIRLCQLLAGWDIFTPVNLAPEIRADNALADAARKILPNENAIICHIASSRSKKEWPATHWAELHRLAKASGLRLVFTTAKGEREQALMDGLRKLAPDAEILPFIRELPLFLAVLARAKVFVSGDTGPLHFAAALGVPTISLFGSSPAARWAPIGEKHQMLQGAPCTCDGKFPDCRSQQFCLAAISPAQVFAALNSSLAATK